MFRPGQTPPSPLSSRHSSQESLHKNAMVGMSRDASAAAVAAAAAAQKKKGIKSSLGRFFSKKDKVLITALNILRYSSISLFYFCTGQRQGNQRKQS